MKRKIEKVKQMKIKFKNSIHNKLINWGNSNNIKLSAFYWLVTASNIMLLTKNWFKLFYWRLFELKRKYVQMNLKNGYSLEIHSKADLSMFDEIWGTEVYNPTGFEIQKSDVVLDIGAHLGFFSLYAAKKAKKGKVYSYEPFKTNFSGLKHNVKLNNLKNISINNVAVSNKSGLTKFYPFEGHNGCHSLFYRGQNKNALTVKTTTLKEILLKNKIKKCNFLKLDCEGAEFRILLTADNNTLNKIEKIAGELHEYLQKEFTTRQLMQHLKKNGFECVETNGMFYAKKI